MIYHGVFATGFFQSIYRAEPARVVMLFTSLEYQVAVNLPLLALVDCLPGRLLIPVAAVSLMLSLGVCVAAAAQSELPRSKRRWWSRPLMAALYFLQPIVRGWARYQGRVSIGPVPRKSVESLESLALQDAGPNLGQSAYWGDYSVDRVTFVKRMIDRLGEQGWKLKVDAGWCDYDVEVLGSRWALSATGHRLRAASRRKAASALPLAHRVVAAGARGHGDDFVRRVHRHRAGRAVLLGGVAALARRARIRMVCPSQRARPPAFDCRSS